MKAFQTMKSMELDDEESLDAPMPIKTDKPDYPWGLRICLTEKEFEKLGLDPDEAVLGGIVHGHFMATVTSVNSSASGEDRCHRVEFQITDLEIESEDQENEESEATEKSLSSRFRSLYKK